MTMTQRLSQLTDRVFRDSKQCKKFYKKYWLSYIRRNHIFKQQFTMFFHHQVNFELSQGSGYTTKIIFEHLG